jgi:hypothetical protein
MSAADLKLTSPLQQRAYAYWQSKLSGRRMPARKDLEPTEIPELLANLVLVDVSHDPLDFRYRLIGTAIVERIAFDYTGKRFVELDHQEPGSKVWETAARICEERAPLISDIPYVGPDQWVRGYRDLYLPLSDDGEQVNMIVGIVEFLDAGKPEE